MAIALSPPTLGKLISTVRNMLNQPNSSNSFWTDAEITDYINEGIRVYYAEVVQNMEGQWTTVTNLDIVSGTETVALPDDCYEVKGVWKVTSNGYVVLPYRNNLTESIANVSGASGSDTYFPTYAFREGNLTLRPIPNYSETGGLRVEYVYFPESLVNPSDTVSPNLLPLFKQVVEMYAVYKAKIKESLVNGVDMSSIAKSNLDGLYRQFVESVRGRSKYPVFIRPFNPEYYT